MGRLRNMTGVLTVWSTAAATLLAGTPHYNCRCPDGSIKRFCFSSASGQSSCCCNGMDCFLKTSEGKSCCRKQTAGNQGAANPSGCCKASKSQVASVSKPVKELTVGGACCQKTLAEREFQSSVRGTTIVDEASVAVFVSPAARAIEYFSNAAPRRTIFLVHWSLPPTDLVMALHRLTI